MTYLSETFNHKGQLMATVKEFECDVPHLLTGLQTCNVVTSADAGVITIAELGTPEQQGYITTLTPVSKFHQ